MEKKESKRKEEVDISVSGQLTHSTDSKQHDGNDTFEIKGSDRICNSSQYFHIADLARPLQSKDLHASLLSNKHG